MAKEWLQSGWARAMDPEDLVPETESEISGSAELSEDARRLIGDLVREAAAARNTVTDAELGGDVERRIAELVREAARPRETVHSVAFGKDTRAQIAGLAREAAARRERQPRGQAIETG